MTGWAGLLVPLAALSGWLVCGLFEVGPRVADWWRVRRGRRVVRAVVEAETARHVGGLVPGQRQSADPVWHEFVPQDGDDR